MIFLSQIPADYQRTTGVQMLFVQAPFHVFNGSQLAGGDTCNPLVSHPPSQIQIVSALPSARRRLASPALDPAAGIGRDSTVWGANGALKRCARGANRLVLPDRSTRIERWHLSIRTDPQNPSSTARDDPDLLHRVYGG